MRRLKVYSCNLDGMHVGVVATTSKKKAAELLGVSYYHFCQFGHETGNDEDVAVARSKPMTAFKKGYERGSEWIPTPNLPNPSIEG
jgi:hypothetical protein